MAIGTIADCQSILEPTNRKITKAGIGIIRQYKCAQDGLEQLLIQTKIRAKIDQGYTFGSQDIAFSLSPMLNSSGRITHAKLSIATVLSEKLKNKLNFAGSGEIIGASSSFASELIETNQNRKQIVRDKLEEIEQVAQKQILENQKLIWIESNSLNKGIIGLLASRLENKYRVPIIIVTLPKTENGDKEFGGQVARELAKKLTKKSD